MTFHTRPDATWSDGEPLTADDAAWTFNMIKKYADGPTGTWAGTVQFLETIEATDANTLVATVRDARPAPGCSTWASRRSCRPRSGRRSPRATARASGRSRTNPRTESRSWAAGRSS